MSFGLFTRRLSMVVPGAAGAVLLAGLASGLWSCGKKGGTPGWDMPRGRLAVAAEIAKPVVTAPQSEIAAEPAPDPSRPGATDVGTAGGLRFIAYNVENWLTMDRFVNQKLLKSSPKPAAEKTALIQILVKHTPDVVGLCEIGEARDLTEIQQALKAAGLDLPHAQYSGGSDPVRHLGCLSRYPLTVSAPPAVMEFQMKGQTFAINRGILDVTLQAHGKPYRLLGVHLKSKREIEEADQEDMRIHEARLLRRHVDAILKADGDARLIVYGDFNDTRPSKAFKTVTGSYNDPGYLTAIPFKDSRGEAWTHYWALHDIYTRLDFVTVSRALKPDVDFRACRIIEDPAWNEASDHRPVLAIFK